MPLTYEVYSLLCPQCGGRMKIIAFLTYSALADKIINHHKLTFVAERPATAHLAFQVLLMAAEALAEYLS